MVVAQEIDGYRSARFGMSESGVLEAIEADFSFARDAVIRNTHEMEKTVVLTIFVDNLVDGTGRTEVAYILGFRSRTLIQVNLLWRLAPGTAAHSRQLQWAADAIINRLALRGVPRVDIPPDTLMEDGAELLFRGHDNRGSSVLIGLKRGITKKG